jgi:hypothetical protein
MVLTVPHQGNVGLARGRGDVDCRRCERCVGTGLRVLKRAREYSTTISSAIAVAMFAAIGTWAVAKYAFGRAREEHQ